MVTGGAGFLGSHLCERLLDRGTAVLCLDSFVTGTRANVEGFRADPRFRLLECDVTDALPVHGPVDLVLHFASPASPADYLRLPIETLRAGSLGTMHALDLARAHGARFVLASTSEVYGDPLEHPQRETYWGNVNPVGPRGVYDEAKRFAEALTTAYRTRHGTDTAIVRIFNSYGPRMRPGDGRAIPTFIRQALRGDPLTVTGDGRQTRTACHVADTVAGVLALADSRCAGPVNIGGTRETTILDLALRIRELAGSRSPVRLVAAPVDDPRTRRPDTSRARETLGWTPEVPLTRGLRETIAWFRDRLGDGTVPEGASPVGA
ncbi:NAD-dependent epimerase/dehydratase family protein [Actinomadura atramentaria]|uniref:NAD-dependent epimerase/dehydratase family protein n=1 Tax=Actinomadura atramentaria TaxID=1990 RepID=UPI000382C75E